MADLVEEKQHARLSPSGSKRWMTCPGSISLIEKLGIEDKPSKFAAEGTVAHEVHELCLVGELDAVFFLGKTIEADGFSFTVNQNMVDAVQESLDYIRQRIIDAQDLGLRVELIVEERSSLKYLNIPGLDGGTADVVMLFWDGESLEEVEVVDYKHGQGVAVEVVDNTQALCYGLGVVMQPKFNEQIIPGGIRNTISQPRAHHPDGSIRTWEISKDYITDWEQDQLVPKAKRCHDEDAELVPSDEGCRFCPAAGQCPALYKRTQEVAMMDFDDPESQLPDPVSLTAEQKRFVMDHATALRAFIVAVENQIKLEMDAGSQEYSDHYKLVRKKTNRKFMDDAFDPDFSPLYDYLEEDDMFSKKPATMAQIEKALKAKLKEDGVESFVKMAKEIMDDVTIKPEGDLVVAPESDKRMGVQPAIVGDFANLDD